MSYLIDTKVLARLANATDIHHVVAANAVVKLHRRGEVLNITPQVLIEFRSVATRPKAQNGLGLTAAEADAQAAGFLATFALLEDTPDIYPAWQALVAAMGIIGKQMHDARPVAVCHVHAQTHLLTLNVSDFIRMSGFGPGIVVVDPATV